MYTKLLNCFYLLFVNQLKCNFKKSIFCTYLYMRNFPEIHSYVQYRSVFSDALQGYYINNAFNGISSIIISSNSVIPNFRIVLKTSTLIKEIALKTRSLWSRRRIPNHYGKQSWARKKSMTILSANDYICSMIVTFPISHMKFMIPKYGSKAQQI